MIERAQPPPRAPPCRWRVARHARCCCLSAMAQQMRNAAAAREAPSPAAAPHAGEQRARFAGRHARAAACAQARTGRAGMSRRRCALLLSPPCADTLPPSRCAMGGAARAVASALAVPTPNAVRPLLDGALICMLMTFIYDDRLKSLTWTTDHSWLTAAMKLTHAHASKALSREVARAPRQKERACSSHLHLLPEERRQEAVKVEGGAVPLHKAIYIDLRRRGTIALLQRYAEMSHHAATTSR